MPKSVDLQSDYFRESTIQDLSEQFMADLADTESEHGTGEVMHSIFNDHLTLVENTVLSRDRTLGTGPGAR